MADHVVVGTGTKGTRYISKRYPVAEGLIAGTTKQTGTPYLELEEKSLALGVIAGT